MSFDYSKLCGRIAEKNLTRGEVARLMGISGNTLISRMKNRSYFNSQEIEKLCGILDIDALEISLYFFTPRVEVSKHSDAVVS